MKTAIEDIRAELEAIQLETPEQFELWLQKHLPSHPFLRCALDLAANDWYGKKLGKPLYEIWGTKWHTQVPMTNYTIGIDSIEKMVAKMKETPWPIYKIKL